MKMKKRQIEKEEEWASQEHSNHAEKSFERDISDAAPDQTSEQSLSMIQIGKGKRAKFVESVAPTTVDSPSKNINTMDSLRN